MPAANSAGSTQNSRNDRGAPLVTLACTAPPDKRSVWTIQLLADTLVELHVIDQIADETVRRTLGKDRLKPWQKGHWCLATMGAVFFAVMEDVCDL